MLPEQDGIKLIEFFKVCTGCGIRKCWTGFDKRKNRSCGIVPACKICSKLRIEIYRKIHKKELIAYQKIYNKNNKKKRSDYKKAHRNETNIQQQIHRRTNFKRKLNDSMSLTIRQSLKGNKKGKHWESLVGYTVKKLKKHLEKLFTENMTWEKFLKGEIHIDHKIPISVFNFTKPEHRDFQRCWALSNLQPMWAQENLFKGAKIDKHFQPSLLI